MQRCNTALWPLEVASSPQPVLFMRLYKQLLTYVTTETEQFLLSTSDRNKRTVHFVRFSKATTHLFE